MERYGPGSRDVETFWDGVAGFSAEQAKLVSDLVDAARGDTTQGFWAAYAASRRVVDESPRLERWYTRACDDLDRGREDLREWYWEVSAWTAIQCVHRVLVAGSMLRDHRDAAAGPFKAAQEVEPEWWELLVEVSGNIGLEAARETVERLQGEAAA